MKNLALLFAVILIISCKKQQSSDCLTDYQKHPYLDQPAIDWLEPAPSDSAVFVADDGIHERVMLSHVASSYDAFIGGEECGALFPSKQATYNYIDGTSQTRMPLLEVKAVEHAARFYSSVPGSSTETMFLDIDANKGYQANSDLTVQILDTVINDSIIPMLRFLNINNNQGVNFNQLTYIKGQGVVGFTDRLGIHRVKK